MTRKEAKWDLPALFHRLNRQSIQYDFTAIKQLVDSFVENYRGEISTMSAQQINRSILDYENIEEKVQDLSLYANLLYSSNVLLKREQDLNENVNSLLLDTEVSMAFFELELGSLLNEQPNLTSNPALSHYSDFLQRIKRKALYSLSEREEQMILQKDQTGVKAWKNLRVKWIATRQIHLVINGKSLILPFGKAISYFVDRNRENRRLATESIFSHLIADGEIFSSCLGNLAKDWVKTCKKRNCDVIEPSLVTNDVDLLMVTNLVESIQKQISLLQQYCKIKSELMSLPKLTCYDLNGPLPNHEEMFDYERAKKLVLQAYRQFDDEYMIPALKMLTNHQINVFPRFGKRTETFCSPWYKGKSAFIILNFNGSLIDTFDLAHELGHATYDYLAQQNQPFVNTVLSPVLSETASTFGELLLADHLLANTQSESEKQVILCSLFDKFNLSVFHVTARYLFEKNIYNLAEKGDALEFEAICKTWEHARQKIYGSAIDWSAASRAEWTITPHYFMDNFRFYNYPYAYSQLLVLALFKIYQQNPKEFVPLFKHSLSMGSSISPKQFCELFGLDVTDQSVWHSALKRYAMFLTELKDLT